MLLADSHASPTFLRVQAGGPATSEAQIPQPGYPGRAYFQIERCFHPFRGLLAARTLLPRLRPTSDRENDVEPHMREESRMFAVGGSLAG